MIRFTHNRTPRFYFGSPLEGVASPTRGINILTGYRSNGFRNFLCFFRCILCITENRLKAFFSKKSNSITSAVASKIVFLIQEVDCLIYAFNPDTLKISRKNKSFSVFISSSLKEVVR